MKKTILLLTLGAGFCSILANRVAAQTLTTLHSFDSGIPKGGPFAGLVLSSNKLYGTVIGGGSWSNGAVFAINTDGTGFTNLYSFSAASGPPPSTNSDGGYPSAKLILSGNTLYGTARYGGRSGRGTVFAIRTDGTGFTNLHSFMDGSDGSDPLAGLILSGITLYGTTYGGNSTVFAVNTDGSGFVSLHDFTYDEGTDLDSGLILSGNTLYGTAGGGGSSGKGTVFTVHTVGTGFTNLYSFTETVYSPDFDTNGDGALPHGPLILSGNTLYGTTSYGGNSGRGTVFAVNSDGTGFKNLYDFLDGGNDGAPTSPSGGLILSGDTLYGTTAYGGSSSNGSVFKIKTEGTGYSTLYSFTARTDSTNTDGANPVGGVILSRNTLYGTTARGGSSGFGTVFSLTLPPPPLTIISSEASVILTWPTNAAGFTLQSAPAIIGTFTNIPGATSPHTNSISGAQQFFRLISN